MSTNVNIYVPNQGEIEALRSMLLNNALELGIYRTAVVPDGSTLFATLTELTTGGGRGYARKALTPEILETLRTSSKWYLSTNAQGRAEGAYDSGVLTWTFNAYDVADGYTAYGVFAVTYQIPFDAGATEIRVGDTIKGGTSGATGVVTEVCVQSGTWAAGTAAGYIKIKSKSGTFQNDENLYLSGEIATVAIGDAGTDYAVGDIVEVTQTGGAGAKLVVTSVDAYGGVTGIVVVEGGQGFSVDTDLATVALTGSGADDLTIDISTLASTAYAVSNTGATADAHQKLMAVWAFPSGVEIDTAGQTITWDMKIALSTGL